MADAKQMVIAGLDQQYAESIEMYDRFEPQERALICDWLCGKHGPLSYAPPWVLDAVVVLAQAGFLETANRWALRREEDDE